MVVRMFFSLLVFGYVGIAAAEQSAEMICVKNHTETLKGSQALVCDTYELRVSIATSATTGQAGIFGIIAYSEDNKNLAYWTEANGWRPYTPEDLIQPVEPVERALKKVELKREFEVYQGSLEGICKLSNNQNFNVYAWHATLKPDQVKKVRTFLTKYDITDDRARNFWNMFALHEAKVGKKWGWVYSHECKKSE